MLSVDGSIAGVVPLLRRSDESCSKGRGCCCLAPSAASAKTSGKDTVGVARDEPWPGKRCLL